MAKNEQNFLDDVVRRVRDLVKELERMLNPQRTRVPVPVPVRPPQPSRRDSYR